jgi:MarR family 2-MHQ and catechol resistance regulon transcriptional repressor
LQGSVAQSDLCLPKESFHKDIHLCSVPVETGRQEAMQRRASNEEAVSKGSKQATPEQLWIAIAHCYRAMSSLIERSFQNSGLSLTDFMLLEGLLHKGSMTITEIQASALLATGSMTAAIDRLESKGLIARTLSKSDRRARVLQLTGEGKAVITLAYQEHSGDLKRWMGVLSADERSSTFTNLRKLERQLKGIDINTPL